MKKRSNIDEIVYRISEGDLFYNVKSNEELNIRLMIMVIRADMGGTRKIHGLK